MRSIRRTARKGRSIPRAAVLSDTGASRVSHTEPIAEIDDTGHQHLLPRPEERLGRTTEARSRVSASQYSRQQSKITRLQQVSGIATDSSGDEDEQDSEGMDDVSQNETSSLAPSAASTSETPSVPDDADERALPSHADSVLKFAIAAAKREHQAATDARKLLSIYGCDRPDPTHQFHNNDGGDSEASSSTEAFNDRLADRLDGVVSGLERAGLTDKAALVAATQVISAAASVLQVGLYRGNMSFYGVMIVLPSQVAKEESAKLDDALVRLNATLDTAVSTELNVSPCVTDSVVACHITLHSLLLPYTGGPLRQS